MTWITIRGYCSEAGDFAEVFSLPDRKALVKVVATEPDRMLVRKAFWFEKAWVWLRGIYLALRYPRWTL